MAEERLIDTDKDKKYRFRINENGEEELIIDDGAAQEESGEEVEVGFEVPELSEDDEEAATMTPEQLAERRKQLEREKAENDKKVKELLAVALERIGQDKYSTALEAACAAEELDPENGGIHALKLVIYTRSFTDYTQCEKAAEAAECAKKYCPAEDIEDMRNKAGDGLKAEIEKLGAEVEKLNAENEEKKAERSVRFDADKKKALIVFLAVAVPTLAALICTIYFSTVIFASADGLYLILTIACGAVALVGLALTAFFGRKLSIAARRVRLNKRNTSTKLGRELTAKQSRLKALNAIYVALN